MGVRRVVAGLGMPRSWAATKSETRPRGIPAGREGCLHTPLLAPPLPLGAGEVERAFFS